MNYKLLSILFICLFSMKALSVQAQNCAKKKLATKEMREDFDYRGQSLFVEMANGDSTELNVVLYSKQNYRIFVVGEQKLGRIDYQVIVPRKKFKRVVKDIQPKEIVTYKKDPSGFYLYDMDGKRIPDGKISVQDTIWSRETTSIKELVYDSRTAEIPYWLATPSKTQLITIKVSVETAEKILNGCVGLYVGREFVSTYQFRR